MTSKESPATSAQNMDQKQIHINGGSYTLKEANALALAAHRSNNPVVAIAIYDHILAKFPDYAGGWNNRAVMLNLLQRYDEAVASAEKAIALQPGNAGFHCNRGDALRELQRYEDALFSYEQALALQYNTAELYNNRAAVLKQLGRYDEALANLNQAIILNPQSAEAYNNRGTVLQEMKRNEEAVASYDQAITLQPGHAKAHNNRGTVLELMKRYDEALAEFDKAIALNPNYAEAHCNRGDLLAGMGDMQGAEVALTTALRLKPELHRVTLSLTRLHRHTDFNGEEVKNLRAVIDNPATVPADKGYLYFSLGKIHDDCGQYDDAFACYAQANQLVNNTIRYDRDRTRTFVDSNIAVFNNDLFAQPHPFASEDTSPLFIVGMPRSGTTLVANALSNHPAIDTAGELPTITELVIHLPELLGGSTPYPQAVKHITPTVATGLIQDYLMRLRRDASPKSLYVIDKQTLNFHHLGLIALLFPKARVIHCMRDPLDTCLSNYFQFFPLDYTYAFDLQNIGHFYKEYTRLMAHWRSVLPIKMIEIPYERMIMDTKAAMQNVLDSLGVVWDDHCLTPHTNPCVVETASSWQVRQPIYQHALRRWRHYEKHLQSLKDALDIT